MKWLLDTNVVSETYDPRQIGASCDWIAQQPPTLVAISVVTLAELQHGVSLKQHRSRAMNSIEWIGSKCTTSFADRMLPIDADILIDWLGLTERCRRTAPARCRPICSSPPPHASTISSSSPATLATSPIPASPSTIPGPTKLTNGSAVNIVTPPGSLAGQQIKRLARPLRAIVGEKYAITDPAMQEPYLREMRDLYHGAHPDGAAAGLGRRSRRRSSSSPTRPGPRSCRRAATPAWSAGRSRITARSCSRSTGSTGSARSTRPRTPSPARPASRSGACARRRPKSTGSIRCCCRPRAPARSAAISRPMRAAPRRVA